MKSYDDMTGRRCIMCASLPFNTIPMWPLIMPTCQLSREVLDHFRGGVNGTLHVSGPIHHQILKMYDRNTGDPECEYCGVSHVEHGRCASCGAPSRYERTGGWKCLIKEMPRYDFDPVMGYVIRTPDELKTWAVASYEMILMDASKSEDRVLLMVCRVARFSPCCY